MNSKILSLNGSHDASATFIDKNGKLRIIEYERLCGKRYGIYKQAHEGEFLGTSKCERLNFLNYVKNNLKDQPEILLHCDLYDDDIDEIFEIFPTIKEDYCMGHHRSHNYGSYALSGFDDALCISLDGGGMDWIEPVDEPLGMLTTWTCAIYRASLEEFVEISSTSDPDVSVINPTHTINFNPGIYGIFGHFISEISKSSNVSNSDKFPLTYAGKIMGLSGYGNLREEWVEPIRKFYLNHPFDFQPKKEYPYVGGEKIYQLGIDMGIELYQDCFTGKDSFDLAFTNQYVFEQLCFEYIKPFIDDYNLDVVFSGGCALNVLFNQKLVEYLTDKRLKLYISPFPNDCGLSFGHYVYFQELRKVNLDPYCGVEILDPNSIHFYKYKYNNQKKLKQYTPQLVVDLISQGMIGAIIDGYSEVGPRALGNRSIICDPSFPFMKDDLNSKVKFREWFRPFAPVCLVEDKDLYFEKSFPSQYMSYAPLVRKCWKDYLPSITHIDGTTRLQTVMEDQHKIFYDILKEMKYRNKPAVILNTSFNIKGKPILTKIEDAFHVLEQTELDFLVVDNHIFLK